MSELRRFFAPLRMTENAVSMTTSNIGFTKRGTIKNEK